MNKWIELALGLILVIIPIIVAFYTYPVWGRDAVTVLCGGIFWVLVGAGALFILLGISDLKS